MTSEEPLAQPSTTSARAHVLAIDDDPLILKALTRLLGREHHVQTESNPKHALARLSGGEVFDVVFCDMMMPDMTGVEFFNLLRAQAPAVADRVVFLTGGAFTPEASAFLERGANIAISKPFSAADLRRAVEDVCRDRGLASAASSPKSAHVRHE